MFKIDNLLDKNFVSQKMLRISSKYLYSYPKIRRQNF